MPSQIKHAFKGCTGSMASVLSVIGLGAVSHTMLKVRNAPRRCSVSVVNVLSVTAPKCDYVQQQY